MASTSGLSRREWQIAASAALLAIGLVAPSVAVRAQDSRAQASTAEGLVKLGDQERKRNKSEAAASFYAKAIQMLGDRPETAPALTYLGFVAISKKDFPQAIGYLERAERADSSQPGPARMWMAIAREREQRFDEAETLYRMALSAADPPSTTAAATMTLLARLLRRQGRADEASELENRVVAIQKANAAEAASKLTLAPGVYRAGQGVTAPSLVYRQEPEYSEEARIAKLDGTVIVSAEIGTDGMVHNIQLLSGVGFGLDENALEAISLWRFQPGIRDGQPVVVRANIEITFRLL